jgi:hypothetical protein
LLSRFGGNASLKMVNIVASAQAAVNAWGAIVNWLAHVN